LRKQTNWSPIFARGSNYSMHTQVSFSSATTPSAPRLNYLLRSAPVYLEEDILANLDSTIRATAEKVTNVMLDDRAWTQASLPVRLGGLGLRSAQSIALPCYISSLTKSQELVRSILSPTANGSNHLLNRAKSAFQTKFPTVEYPTAELAKHQRA